MCPPSCPKVMLPVGRTSASFQTRLSPDEGERWCALALSRLLSQHRRHLTGRIGVASVGSAVPYAAAEGAALCGRLCRG